MNLPKEDKGWASEAIGSLNVAVEMIVSNEPNLSREVLESIYQYAPGYCLENRGVHDLDLAREVTEHVIVERMKDFEKEPDSTMNYSANFLLAYLESHVYLRVISKEKMKAIMEYISVNYDIEM